MGELVFILGGIKSGKSVLAEQLAGKQAESRGRQVIYLATARIQDEETRERVRKHRARRPQAWRTEESPLDPEKVFTAADGGNAVVLMDCLNFFLTNLLIEADADREDVDRDGVIAGMLGRVEVLLEAIAQTDANVIVVSNEVGQCPVALTRLGRIFQDVMGMAHQMVARRADEVYVVTAGIPHQLK